MVAASVIKFYDLLQRGIGAVVKVGPGQFHVPQAGRFERPVDGIAVERTRDRHAGSVPE